MARSRNIKPAFFQNEKLAELKPINRLAFIALWTVCDFKGCLEYRPKRLKVQLLPYDDCNIEEIINNLVNSGFIQIYSVEDQDYIKILNFEKHQNPHKNEKEAGSDIPDIDGTRTDNIGTSRADSLLLIPDSLNPLTEEWEEDFELFYKEYPKKVAPQKAKQAWKKIRPNIEVVLQALAWQKQSKQWFEKGGQFIPNPATWINGHQFLNKPPEQVTF
jgi:hypothetical protein